MVENTLVADCDFLFAKSTMAQHLRLFFAPHETIVCTICAKKKCGDDWWALSIRLSLSAGVSMARGWATILLTILLTIFITFVIL